ncbi:MAG: hypothetical protein KDC46_13480, partial [Thermoleophilia bacterium]|nr:hypothetical protein [Thermoleophilia bacterium]
STPRTAVELQLRPFGDAGRGIVRRWHVESMKLERGGLLLLARDVSYVRHGRVGVLAPTPELATARSIAADADRMLPELVRRYPRMRPAGHGAFIVLAPSSGRASKVMSTLDRGTLDHAAGVATSERNVSISLDAWHGMMGIERQSLLRHELTHLATVTLARSGYQLYTEGIAEWEGDHEIVRTGRYYLKNDSAIAGVRSGALDLDKLLFEQDAMEGLGADKWKAYRLGAQVAEYLDSTYGHDRTVKFLAMIGTERDVRVAVRRVLHTSPGAYRSSVERWVVAHPTWMG